MDTDRRLSRYRVQPQGLRGHILRRRIYYRWADDSRRFGGATARLPYVGLFAYSTGAIRISPSREASRATAPPASSPGTPVRLKTVSAPSTSPASKTARPLCIPRHRGLQLRQHQRLRQYRRYLQPGNRNVGGIAGYIEPEAHSVRAHQRLREQR